MGDHVLLKILAGPGGLLADLTSTCDEVASVAALPLVLPAIPPADGPALWTALPEPVRRELALLSRLARPAPLWLDLQAPTSRVWPWEQLIPDLSGAQPFSLLPTQPLVRFLAAGPRPGPAHLDVLRVLVLAASPHDRAPLDVAPLQTLLASLQPAPGLAQLHQHCGVRQIPNLLRSARPDLLIVLAHGEPGLILLEDSGGSSVALPAQELASFLHGTTVRCVVLATCAGGMPADDGRSAAEALLAAGVAGVVAMRGPVALPNTIAFLEGFLAGVIAGEAPEVAAVHGRLAILAREGQAGQWDLPVCWQRALHRPLVLTPPAALRQGAAILSRRAPTLPTTLLAGGTLGLLAAATVQPLLASLLSGGAVALPALIDLLNNLGLNVFAGYLGSALGDVWRRTGGGPAAATSDEVGQALRLITAQQADAAAQLADLAQTSRALEPLVRAIRAESAGSQALLRGLDRDLQQHGAALYTLGDTLRRDLAGLSADMRQGLHAIFEQGTRIEAKVETAVAQGEAIKGDTEVIRKQLEGDAAERQAQKQALLRSYLAGLSHTCNQLPLLDAGSQGVQGQVLTLDGVYVELEIERTQAAKGKDAQRTGGEQRRLTVLEALAQQPRLVLLGAPGSGKSTVVSFTARCLAQAALAEPSRWLATLGTAWTCGVLVPITVELRAFSAWLVDQTPRVTNGNAELVWTFLATRQSAALVDLLRRLAHTGRALLLFDGLDEVGLDAQGWPLRPVTASISALVDSLGQGSRALITCRILDYPPRQLNGWPADTLAPLSPELQRRFIARWYAALDQLQRALSDTPAALQAGLERAVSQRAELRRLAGNPLLLTMMALVHTYDRLPDSRVLLYQRCIERLLLNWRTRRHDQLPSRLDLRDWHEHNLWETLFLLGYEAHRRGVHADGESGADLPYELVTRTLTRYFARLCGQQRSAERAGALADFMGQASNGVLQVYEHRRGDELTYRFPHRTFQEYLAGHALINGDLLLSGTTPDSVETADDERDLITRTLRLVDAGAQWREALLMAAGRLILNGDRRKVVELAQELLPDDPGTQTEDQARRTMLATDLLVEVGQRQIEGMGRLKESWRLARESLLPLLPFPVGSKLLLAQPAERARAGLLLARLGDPRPGVCALPHSHDDQDYWCGPFAAGTYQIAEGKQRVRLETFRVGRYPVTVWQYRQFVAAGGYQEQGWWTKEGWQLRDRLWPPYLWNDPEWTADNQPVVGVSWYEALAFCAWLSDQLALPKGWTIRLPSEAEWEVAAMWDAAAGQMREWSPPEGELWQNVKEAGIGRTSPVGLFPQRTSPCGALDMAGNVWEWCMSSYKAYPDKAQRLIEDFRPQDYDVALRGGAYYLQNTSSGWGARDGFDPGIRSLNWSFRVIVCSSLP